MRYSDRNTGERDRPTASQLHKSQTLEDRIKQAERENKTRAPKSPLGLVHVQREFDNRSLLVGLPSSADQLVYDLGGGIGPPAGRNNAVQRRHPRRRTARVHSAIVPVRKRSKAELVPSQ
ncbi:hypothetical protein PANT_9c00138 [Moesziomyces antarcticus T-34]|uniref:Uncharacterized protein n=1 Tax=Pseudozyma antarctica (strain T-34) TaxID=1151754 RepID=M9LNM4_PSEA3|nr:hypothetical protein PANT_9c00138 [Moesziomyces antarcticus T-34]